MTESRKLTLVKYPEGTYLASSEEITASGKSGEDALIRLAALLGIEGVEVHNTHQMGELLDLLIGDPA